jgi:hypothetical protein
MERSSQATPISMQSLSLYHTMNCNACSCPSIRLHTATKVSLVCTFPLPSSQVASATSVVLVFISSSAASLSFLTQGRLITSYALLFSLCAAVGSICGITVAAAVVQRTGRPSSVVLLLAVCMAAGAVLSGIFGALDFAAAVRENEDMGFAAICERQ